MLTAEIDKRAFCIFARKQADGSFQAFGSGCFFMRRDIVLTAKHVVEESSHETDPITLVSGSVYGRFVGARPLEFWPHPEIDIGLVRVAPAGGLPECPLYPAHLSLNQHSGAFAVGYNPKKSNPETNDWVIEINKVREFDAVDRERLLSTETVIEYEAPFIEPGNSGGPLVTLGGGVIAVTTSWFREANENGKLGSKRGRATSIYPAIRCFKSPFERQR